MTRTPSRPMPVLLILLSLTLVAEPAGAQPDLNGDGNLDAVFTQFESAL